MFIQNKSRVEGIIVKETLVVENEKYETYGLSITFSEGGDSRTYTYNDLCCDYDRIKRLLDSIKSNDVSECHIFDVVEDFLV